MFILHLPLRNLASLRTSINILLIFAKYFHIFIEKTSNDYFPSHINQSLLPRGEEEVLVVENVPDQPLNHFWFGEVPELRFSFPRFSQNEIETILREEYTLAKVLFVSRGWKAGAEPRDLSSIGIPAPREMN